MSDEISRKLQKSFNLDRLGHALFYNWQYSLRFKLSTGDSSIEMFTSAYDRARELLQHAFENSDDLHILIKFYACIPDEQKHPKEMRRLKRCGFKLPEIHDYALSVEESEACCYEYLLPAQIDNSNYLATLWATCSKDLGIQPSAKVSCYFIDFSRQIIAHPYDDRGMDIVAIEKESISFLYRDYYHWLLNYDLEIMNRNFNKGTSFV